MRAFQSALVATAVLALAVGPDARAQVSLDASFVGGGRETIGFDLNAAATDRALRVFPTVGGLYLLAGQASSATNQFALALTRVFPGGNSGGGAQGVDASFGVDGKLTIALGLSPVVDIAQDSQGRLIVGFLGPSGGGVDVFLTRLLADGSIDGSFGVGGFASLGIELIDDPNPGSKSGVRSCFATCRRRRGPGKGGLRFTSPLSERIQPHSSDAL
jgi:hypothetical protein